MGRTEQLGSAAKPLGTIEQSSHSRRDGVGELAKVTNDFHGGNKQFSREPGLSPIRLRASALRIEL